MAAAAAAAAAPCYSEHSKYGSAQEHRDVQASPGQGRQRQMWRPLLQKGAFEGEKQDGGGKHSLEGVVPQLASRCQVCIREP